MPRFEWMSLLEYTNWYHGCLHWKENTLRIEYYNSDIASILPWLIHIWTLRTQTSKHTALPSVGQTITLRVCPPMAVQQIVHSRQCWTCFYNGINKPQIPRWLVSQRDTNKQTWVHAPQMFEQVINFVFSLCALQQLCCMKWILFLSVGLPHLWSHGIDQCEKRKRRKVLPPSPHGKKYFDPRWECFKYNTKPASVRGE